MADIHQQERYLGDGLYASFDGYNIILRAPRDQGSHFVFLEPAIFEALVNYKNDIYTAIGGTPE